MRTSPSNEVEHEHAADAPASGDVVLCGSFAGRSPSGADLEERVAFAAPLDTRADLERLLRRLHGQPDVHHLVLFGDDLWIAGEALLALWQGGVDEEGRLPGSRGLLASDLDAGRLEALRADLVVHDWRGRPAAKLASAIADLPVQAKSRASQPIAEPEAPERKTFLSRKTSFPIFSRDVADSWLQLLNLALRIGTPKETPGGSPVAEALNAVVTIGLPVIAEDLEVEVEPPEEFPAFLDFNREDFERFCGKLGAAQPAGGSPPASEPQPGSDTSRSLEAVSDRLAQSLEAQPGAAAVLEPGLLAGTALASDLVSATFDVVDGALYGSFVLRRVDLYGEWPLEAMALVRLQREVAARLQREVGAATFVVHAAQLHERDWDRALRVLKESFKRPLPLQVDHSGIFLFGNDGGQARAMLLDHDASTILWEDAFGTPDDLSWYIVDAMPWLLPQHIRYVGQECSTLKRAIEQGECYEQG